MDINRDEKHELIHLIAKAVRLSKDNKLSALDLTNLLNEHDIRTDSGKVYKRRGRGIYSLIKAAYNAYYYDNDQDGADVIADAYVKPNGDYAYKRK